MIRQGEKNLTIIKINIQQSVQMIHNRHLLKHQVSREATDDREEQRKRDYRRPASAAYIIVVVLETICTHASRTYLSRDARDRESRTQPQPTTHTHTTTLTRVLSQSIRKHGLDHSNRVSLIKQLPSAALVSLLQLEQVKLSSYGNYIVGFYYINE